MVSAYIRQLQPTLPPGVELALFGADGAAYLVSRSGVQRFDPVRNPADRPGFLRFIDDGQFTRYFIGSPATSEENPANATYKLGIVRPHSAFTPHAHGVEHFVLSMGYSSCGLYDLEAERMVHVRLFPGSLLRIPGMLPHSFNNRAGDPLLLLVANTGIGIDHVDYAITAAQAAERARRPTPLIHNGHHSADHHHPPGPSVAPAIDYARLALALIKLEQAMPATALHNRLTWRERIAARLRVLAGWLEQS